MKVFLGGAKNALYFIGSIIFMGVVAKLIAKLFMLGWNIL